MITAKTNKTEAQYTIGYIKEAIQDMKPEGYKQTDVDGALAKLAAVKGDETVSFTRWEADIVWWCLYHMLDASNEILCNSLEGQLSEGLAPYRGHTDVCPTCGQLTNTKS